MAGIGELKLRVFILTDLYLPGFKGGGPIRSLANLVDHLAADIDFLVLTRDRDFGEKEPYPGILCDHWQRGQSCEIQYLSPRRWSWRGLLGALRSREFDVLYLPSFFAKSTIKCLLLRRAGLLSPAGIVVAPRGQLHATAIGYKTRRKRAYIALARRLGFFDGVLLHATNRVEGREARLITGATVHLAPNLAAKDAPADAVGGSAKQSGRVSLVYLSRIHPVKNLEFALTCLAELDGSADVSFDIWGPIEDPAYWRRCRARIAELPANIAVEHRGPAPPQDVAQILSRYDFFVLPTTTENHGHAILEALGAACPVIISDRTPWRGLATAGIGWDLPLEGGEAFSRVLVECIAMGRARHQKMKTAARDFYQRRQDNPELIQQSRELFFEAMRTARSG